MTANVPIPDDIDRVFFVTADCLRWDFHQTFKDVYPPGVWYRAVPQATYTPPSHASLFTGLNPPRHGVYRFNMPTRDETVFEMSDSLISSPMYHERPEYNFRGNPTEHPLVFTELLPDEHTEEGFEVASEWDFEVEPRAHDALDQILHSDVEVSWFHDYIIHASGLHAEWGKVGIDKSAPESLEAFQWHVDMSALAHEVLLDELRERGMYENTLFVFWGDHGQGLNDGVLELGGHGSSPTETVGRVPIAFCSEQFDETVTDKETNARAVDVMPTLETIFQANDFLWYPLNHEYEGVDLTEFQGELAGYCISGRTETTGQFDGVKGLVHSYLNMGKPRLLKSKIVDNWDERPIEEWDDNPIIEQKLGKLYDEVRRGPSRLIVQDDANTDQLEALGYR